MDKEREKLQAAFHFYQQGKLAEAAGIYEQLLKENPNNHDALHFYGILKLAYGQFSEAKQLIERSLATSVVNLPYVENYVSILFNIGDYQQAVNVCLKAIKENRKTEVLQYILAISLFRLGRLNEADDEFGSLLLAYPHHLAGNNERAATLSELHRYEEALSFVDRALRIDPGYAEAFLNKGNILVKMKKYDESIFAYEKALSIKADLFDAHLGCANVYRTLKKFDKSVSAYDKALAFKPDLAEAWLGRGNVLNDIKRFDEATAAFDKALALKPELAGAWLGRANLFTERGRCDEAFAAYDKALALEPNLAEAWHGRGNAFIKLRRCEEALAAYDRALTLKPELAEACLGRGNALTQLRRCDEALVAFDKALVLEPDLAEAWLGRGNAFTELKRCDEALAAYGKALDLTPESAGAWLGRGNVFVEVKHFEEALAAYDKALALDPDLTDALIGRGIVFNELKRYDDACAAFDDAVRIDPTGADAYWNKALLSLCLGQFEEGWDLYEWRSQIRENIAFYSYLKSLNLSVRLNRNALKDKKIAVISEQGVGDEIMFASMLPDLIKDAKTIYYEVDPRLARLFENAFPSAKIVPRGSGSDLREQVFDVKLQAGSLGYAYRRGNELFPGTPYLSAAPTLVNKWKARLATEARLGKNIGLSWRGGGGKTRRNDRSVELKQLSRLIQRDDCNFISLQYGNVSDEISSFNQANAASPVHSLLDDFNNFDDFAALITALDLVISVQNTTIHMCGALGKTCWGMIPWRPEWRYGSNLNSMVWYSSIDLCRQETAGDWDGLIRSLGSKLHEFVGDK